MTPFALGVSIWQSQRQGIQNAQEIIGCGEGCFKDGKHVRMKLRQEEEDAAGAAADPQSEKLPNASEDDDELDLWS